MFRCFNLMVVIAVLTVCSSLTMAATTQGTFTGGDAGEGLDLDGNFLYGVTFGITDAPDPFSVRDVSFSDDSQAGVNILEFFDAPQAETWAGQEYGATTNDNNLERAVGSMIFGVAVNNPGSGTGVRVSLDNLVIGQAYKLQLILQQAAGQAANTRHIDVEIEGVQVLTDYQYGFTAGVGNVITHEFTATDNALDIHMLTTPIFDPNPVLNALTLEIIPEPASIALLGLGGLMVLRRRHH